MSAERHFGVAISFWAVSMSSGPHSFKHRDAARLIRATTPAGLTVKGVSLDGGKITLMVGDATQRANTDDECNPWDEVSSEAPDKKRSS
jgi:hypothetical protein